ncbi:uncharacterized protein LOC144581726 [Callithrix jacchus]
MLQTASQRLRGTRGPTTARRLTRPTTDVGGSVSGKEQGRQHRWEAAGRRRGRAEIRRRAHGDAGRKKRQTPRRDWPLGPHHAAPGCQRGHCLTRCCRAGSRVSDTLPLLEGAGKGRGVNPADTVSRPH